MSAYSHPLLHWLSTQRCYTKQTYSPLYKFIMSDDIVELGDKRVTLLSLLSIVRDARRTRCPDPSNSSIWYAPFTFALLSCRSSCLSRPDKSKEVRDSVSSRNEDRDPVRIGSTQLDLATGSSDRRVWYPISHQDFRSVDSQWSWFLTANGIVGTAWHKSRNVSESENGC